VKFNPVYGDTELDYVLPITVTILDKEETVNISPNGNVSIE